MTNSQRWLGKYESLDALKIELTKDIEARARTDYDNDYYAQLVDKIKEGAVIKYALADACARGRACGR